MSRALLLVGELNPYGAAPAFALYHLPRHASGNRLRRIMGLRDCTYEAIEKVNLCSKKWSLPRAREEAAALVANGGVLVLLGSKVKTAFAGPGFFEAATSETHTLVTLPHPSGLNRLWDEPGSPWRARQLLRAHVPDVPWGEASA